MKASTRELGWLLVPALAIVALAAFGLGGLGRVRDASRAQTDLAILEERLVQDVRVLDSAAVQLDRELEGARRFVDWADEQVDAGSGHLVRILQDLAEPVTLDIGDEHFRDLVATGRAERIGDGELRAGLFSYYDDASRYDRIGRLQEERFVAGLEARLDRGLWLHVFRMEPDEAMAVDFRTNVQRLANEGGTQELRGLLRGLTARRALVGSLKLQAESLRARIRLLREKGGA